MNTRVKGKVAIVTGGAGGIGSATGLLLCEEGASVVLVDRDAAALDAVAGDIRGKVAGAQVLTILADVSQDPEARRIVEETLAKFGRIDVLVNNAGVREYWRLADAPAESWQNILGVNLLSYAFMAKAALPALRQSGKGSIVNLSSTYGVSGRAGMGQYDATKAGILALTRTLAFEEADSGVRVNAVCPGYTLTPFHVRQAESKGRTGDELRSEKVDACLMKRWSDPREVAYPILWLASDEASYMTASTLMVDGGRPVV
ncbi:MAG: 3-hydroxyacyl-CoA dehydrogenase, binding domain protein [Herminiimonas sp.]|nr:3-hydroxyacyl-CoA dehydrogenase, binding domain protein [Herminiimonas sp.]